MFEDEGKEGPRDMRLMSVMASMSGVLSCIQVTSIARCSLPLGLHAALIISRKDQERTLASWLPGRKLCQTAE